MSVINGEEVSGMVEHWLTTPPNGYLGSSYGSDVKALLQLPNSAGLGDQFIDKMNADLPVISALPADATDVYFEQVDKETKRLIIRVVDSLVAVDESRLPG